MDSRRVLHLIVLISNLLAGSNSIDDEAFSHLMHRMKRDAAQDVNVTDQDAKTHEDVKQALSKAPELLIATVEVKPYLMIRKQENDSNGDVNDNDRFVGFIPDLVKQLSRRVPFTYKFYQVPGDKYGTKTPEGTWNGAIGEVVQKKLANGSLVSSAQLAAAPLTITSARSEVVDFLVPFDDMGLTVLVQKEYMRSNTTYDWPISFGIFRPLSTSVWAMIIVSMFVVAVLLTLYNRFNPYEWGGRYNLNLASKYHKESFSFSSSLWFALTTLNWQGFERAPNSKASKVLTCAWFCFMTIVLAGYIGGLVNNLWWASMAKQTNPFKNPLSSLQGIVTGLHGNDFKVGAIRGGPAHYFVTKVGAQRSVELQLLSLYWSSPQGQDALVESEEEALKRVRTEKYAFITETIIAKYLANQKPCDLTTTNDVFAPRSYAFAVPKGSTYLTDLNRALLELKEEHVVDDLERRWWNNLSPCWNHTAIEDLAEMRSRLEIAKAQPKVIDLEMFYGPMVLLIVGTCISLLTTAAEILYFKYKGRYEESNRPQGQTLYMDKDAGGDI